MYADLLLPLHQLELSFHCLNFRFTVPQLHFDVLVWHMFDTITSLSLPPTVYQLESCTETDVWVFLITSVHETCRVPGSFDVTRDVSVDLEIVTHSLCHLVSD